MEADSQSTGVLSKILKFLPLLAVLVLYHSSVRAAGPPAGIAPVDVPSGGFAIDGNLAANTPGANSGDWILVNTFPGLGGAVLNSAGTPLNPLTTFHFTDPYNGNDMVFAGGQKWFDNPTNWVWTINKASAKTDINNVLLHVTRDVEGHTWVVIAADRFSTSGDSYIDFEFLQNTLTRNGNGSFSSTGPDGGRTIGDLVLSLAFTGGGNIPDFLAYRWQSIGAGVYRYVDITASLPIGKVFVALNTTTITVPYKAFGETNYAPNAFAEAALDLTGLLGNFDECLSIGFKTIMVKTKASPSDTATIGDLLDPIQYPFRIGPSVDAGPDQTRCTEGAMTTFSLSGVATPGTKPISSTTWSVVAGAATIDAPNSLVTAAQVFSASATLRLTAAQANGCTEVDDIVLTVSPLPVCSIAGPASTCPGASTQFRAPAGMSAYSWSIAGNAAITGSSNQQTVTITSGSLCGQKFALTLNVTSNNCSSTCASDVMVNDTTPPTLVCPADKVLECPADTRTNVTGTATAQDNCGLANVFYTDAVNNQCGGTKVIHRTWTAVDGCGNSSASVQTITVRDTLKPVIQCPANRTVQCGADTTTNATGVATAQDGCGQVTILYADGVSNKCGGTKIISRVWTAIDECGNRESCVQTITVQDTTKPTIQCPADRVLECGADTRTNATGVATAQDLCGQVSLSFSDSVNNQCGLTKVILRTWTATDECGNASSCVQTITVRDTIKPTIQCPPDRILECPANTSTNVTGVATGQDSCGQVTIHYADSVTNQCTGTKVVLRTWTATDECGNSSSCVQTITVKDTAKPVLTLPPNRVLQCPADTRTNVTGVAIATDTCSPATVRYSDIVTVRCGGAKSIARTWTATDECGNISTGVQTITVDDTTPPTITCPPDQTMECPADTRTNVTGVATASDVCGGVTMAYADSVQSNCGGTKVIKRTWTATDDCGNRQSCVQTITVLDRLKPTLAVPPDRLLECGVSTLPSATGTATAQDGCSQVSITYSDSVVTACGGSRVITRTWTAADACGNSTNGVQMITVRDSTPPSLRLPANLTLQCPGDTRTNVTGVAIALDGCGSVSLSYSDTVSNGCGLTRTVLRLWTATDQCGNTTNGLQTISVVDTTKPSLICPTIKVQCVGDVPAAYADLAAFRAAGGTATDSCSPTLTFSLISDSGLVGRCPGQVTRVYRLTDVCGNVAECTQNITVDDTIPPVMACVSNATLECGASLEPAATGSPTATDNCSSVLITHSDTAVPAQYDLKFYVADPDSGTGPYEPTYLKFGPGSLPCPEDARLTGRALDPIRNAVAYAPSGQLDALTSIGNVPMAFGQIVPFETVIQVTGGVGPERGTIEFTADWSTYTTSNNRFGYDSNYMVYCAFVDAADPGSIDPNKNARVESYSATMVNLGTIAERIRGTFRISGLDSGDRVVVEIWVVLMSAMQEHSGGTVAAELVSAQTAAVPAVPISIGTQTDSLGNLGKIGALPPPQTQPPLGPLPSQPPALPGATVNVIDRTWTATDDCGNISRCVQTITVRDTTAPTMVCPPDRSVLYGEAWTFEQPVATDNCGTVMVRLLDTTTNLTSQTSWLVTRLWGASDQSGNSATCQQNVTIQKPAAAPAPALAIRRIDQANVEISWVAPSTGFQLEACNSTLYSSWTPVPVAPVVLYGRNVVVLPSSSLQKFYRLRK
jgi:hypothetical protein